jgi:CIC family chloride channel protein
MRSPLTATIFALELTYDISALPVLLTGTVIAHAFTVLVMRRSILTEKVARRGYHVSREYSVDPLELISIAEVMSKQTVAIPAGLPIVEVLHNYFEAGSTDKHQGYPVVDPSGKLVGVLTRGSLLEEWLSGGLQSGDVESRANLIIAYDLLHRPPITVFPWESCRAAAERLAQRGVGRLVVVDPENPDLPVGMVTRSDLLKPLARAVEEEQRRERFLGTDLMPTHKQRREEARKNKEGGDGSLSA